MEEHATGPGLSAPTVQAPMELQKQQEEILYIIKHRRQQQQRRRRRRGRRRAARRRSPVKKGAQVSESRAWDPSQRVSLKLRIQCLRDVVLASREPTSGAEATRESEETKRVQVMEGESVYPRTSDR